MCVFRFLGFGLVCLGGACLGRFWSLGLCVFLGVLTVSG